MKTLVILALTFAVSASASEISKDSCGYYRERVSKLYAELSDLSAQAGRLAREEGYYSSSSSEGEGCEEVIDEATYIHRRIENVQKQLKNAQQDVRTYCPSTREP